MRAALLRGTGEPVTVEGMIAGAARIIAIDPVATERDLAVATGATETIDPTAVDAVAVGMPRAGAQVTFEAGDLFAMEKRLVGSFYGSGQVRRDFPRLVALAEAGKLDLGSSITHRIGLDDVNEAFAAMERGDAVRSVITF